MTSLLIRPTSLPWIAMAEEHDSRNAANHFTEGARVLRANYGRGSRLLLGIVAFAAALGSSLGCAVLLFAPGVLIAADIAIGIVAMLILGASAWLLLALWHSGRRLISALGWWMREPYVSGAQSRTASGWMSARTMSFELDLFVRIVTSSLTLLFASLAYGSAYFSVREGFPVWTLITALAWGTIALVAGAAQLGASCELRTPQARAIRSGIGSVAIFRAS